MTQYHNPEGLPESLGLYSHVAYAESTGILSIAGQIGVDMDGSLPDTFAEQLKNIFDYFGVALAAHDMTHDNIIQMTTYVTGRPQIKLFYESRAELFPTIFESSAYPPNTLLIIDGLVLPDAVLEISALAAK